MLKRFQKSSQQDETAQLKRIKPNSKQKFQVNDIPSRGEV